MMHGRKDVFVKDLVLPTLHNPCKTGKHNFKNARKHTPPQRLSLLCYKDTSEGHTPDILKILFRSPFFIFLHPTPTP